ncbi:hypothetical protein HPB47_025800 [Ixodes persulcatus]|uniref:Uncharacterized protein n=1 Tax=Ixodes persulcatus TaxID=34615 RepID=A0AC60Q0W8_IXOPE|nr:hypothetical protein HPB47_025800 [Ixodes persulcatus]
MAAYNRLQITWPLFRLRTGRPDASSELATDHQGRDTRGPFRWRGGRVPGVGSERCTRQAGPSSAGPWDPIDAVTSSDDAATPGPRPFGCSVRHTRAPHPRFDSEAAATTSTTSSHVLQLQGPS